MSKEKSSTDIKNPLIDLLLCDFDTVLSGIKKEDFDCTLTDTQIENIVEEIIVHDNRETIENNLFGLVHKGESLPKCIESIYVCYKNVLNDKSKRIPPPANYATTSIEYLKVQQAEAMKKIAESENVVSQLLANTKSIQTDFENIQTGFENIQTDFKNIQTDFKNTQAGFEEKISKTKDGIILLTVTVLGIFTSLNFSLSGSLSILNNIFDTGNSFAETLLKYSLVGMFIADLVFLLIYIIAKLNNKSIAMHCPKCKTISYICQNCDVRKNSRDNEFRHKKECYACEHKNTSCQECNEKQKTLICKMRNKFFYIYFINVICIIMMLISLFIGITGHGNFLFEGTKESDNSISQASTAEIYSGDETAASNPGDANVIHDTPHG